jgi:hypothetical protein
MRDSTFITSNRSVKEWVSIFALDEMVTPAPASDPEVRASAALH